MTELKSWILQYIVFSQSKIAAMKNEESTALAHPPTTPIPHARLGRGNGGGWRLRQGNYSPANITTVVEMQRGGPPGTGAPSDHPYSPHPASVG